MKNESIFIEIMNLIESQTNMPRLEKDVEKWLYENKNNENIYAIYKLASISRDL